MFLLRVNTDTFDSSDCVVRRNGRFWYFDWETVRGVFMEGRFCACEDTIVVDETAQEKIVDDNGTC
jgi:hypothetical protein|tara:strand:+ start:256 stop:453 length:198 start_codon:yes stop_codon:yes gene_type:complete